MNGGYSEQSVERLDDGRALITLRNAGWYSQDPMIAEYMADGTVLDELEALIRGGRMNFWNNRRFTDMFIADGESTGYSFDFDHSSISFSSQYYPGRYREKLKQLDLAISKYLEDAEKLPGLVNPRAGSDDLIDLSCGELDIYAFSLANKELGIRIINGSEQNAEISYGWRLFDAESGELLQEQEDDHTLSVDAGHQDIMNICLDKRLEAGSYRLMLGETEIMFEIR